MLSKKRPLSSIPLLPVAKLVGELRVGANAEILGWFRKLAGANALDPCNPKARMTRGLSMLLVSLASTLSALMLYWLSTIYGYMWHPIQKRVMGDGCH